MHDFSVLHGLQSFSSSVFRSMWNTLLSVHMNVQRVTRYTLLAPTTIHTQPQYAIIINNPYCHTASQHTNMVKGRGIKKTKQNNTDRQTDRPHHCVLAEGKSKSKLLTITYQAFSCRKQHRNKLGH